MKLMPHVPCNSFKVTTVLSCLDMGSPTSFPKPTTFSRKRSSRQFFTVLPQWSEFLGSLKIGGIGDIFYPPIGRKNTTYIPLIVLAFWGTICYQTHLLREPETTIEFCPNFCCSKSMGFINPQHFDRDLPELRLLHRSLVIMSSILLNIKTPRGSPKTLFIFQDSRS